MDTVVVSATYRIPIPPKVRRAVGIHAGQRVALIPYAGRLELIPVKPMRAARGFLKGIDTTVEREADRT
jgi:AbrB family looped-hinge helix DNA binding protein